MWNFPLARCKGGPYKLEFVHSLKRNRTLQQRLAPSLHAKRRLGEPCTSKFPNDLPQNRTPPNLSKKRLYQTLKKASPSKSKSTLITQNCRKNEASVRKLKLPYRFTENEALQIAILSSKPPTSPART